MKALLRIKWFRRFISFSVYALLFGLILFLAPVLLPLSFLFDLFFRKSWALTRTYLLMATFLCLEWIGIITCSLIWLGAFLFWGLNSPKFFDGNIRLQRWWSGTLFSAAQRLFRFNLDVKGTNDLGPGPIYVLCRHVGIADTLIPSIFISNPHQIVLRFVLKEEILWDPCMDIVGNRLKNAFLARRSLDTDKDIEAILQLLDNLDSKSGIAIYPEGTRFTPEKREYLLKRAQERNDQEYLSMIKKYKNVLPPRPGGVFALLKNNPGVDVVFCAHTGLEATNRLKDFLGGRLIGAQFRIRFWRVGFTEIPSEESRQRDWFFEQWRQVDKIVGELQENSVNQSSDSPAELS